MTIRRPDIAGVTDVAELAAKVQAFAEDVIGALGQDVQIKSVSWSEDGQSKRVTTTVRRPKVIVATAKIDKDGETVVATGSVSFVPRGEDPRTRLVDLEVTDISGLSTGTDYQVSLMIVGEV